MHNIKNAPAIEEAVEMIEPLLEGCSCEIMSVRDVDVSNIEFALNGCGKAVNLSALLSKSNILSGGRKFHAAICLRHYMKLEFVGVLRNGGSIILKMEIECCDWFEFKL